MRQGWQGRFSILQKFELICPFWALHQLACFSAGSFIEMHKNVCLKVNQNGPSMSFLSLFCVHWSAKTLASVFWWYQNAGHLDVIFIHFFPVCKFERHLTHILAKHEARHFLSLPGLYMPAANVIGIVPCKCTLQFCMPLLYSHL